MVIIICPDIFRKKIVKHIGEKKFLKSEARKKTLATTLLIAVLTISSFLMLTDTVKAQPTLLDPTTIPKFTNQLTGPPPVYVPKIIRNPNGRGIALAYTIKMDESMQQVLPTVDELGNPTGFGMTPVWGYGGQAKDAITGKKLGYVLNSPGPSFEAIRGIPTVVKWINNIDTPHMFAVDPTLHWANPNNFPMPMEPVDAPSFPPGYPEAQSPVALIPHLHGGEVQSIFDGHPEAWFTSTGVQGDAYNTLYPTAANAAVFYYPNEQPATTLWYHDHGLGITRLNVMSGLAGFYLLRDPADALGYVLPNKEYEMPIVIQDRIFQSDGSFYFPAGELEGEFVPNPDVHPYWSPEFFGDTIMVNGLVWPNMNVDKAMYRLRLLDGSNARFYTLSFVTDTDAVVPFTQIGTDGGYIKSAVTHNELTIAPGERADILVDFSGLAPGTKILLKNTANTPYPDGDPIDPETTGQIMQFTVTNNRVPYIAKFKQALTRRYLAPGKILNRDLRGSWPTLPEPDYTRTLTLNEVMGENGPLEALINGQKWSADISENVTIGTTEEWVIVNLTGDTHPIHTHLAQFQLVGRIPIDAEAYETDWKEINGEPPFGPGDPIPTELPLNATYITGPLVGPAANEYAWKDTIQMNPGEATIIRIRFAPIDGTPNYPFDPTEGPGYVWHCHILDHEDNEMMRPYLVVN